MQWFLMRSILFYIQLCLNASTKHHGIKQSVSRRIDSAKSLAPSGREDLR